MAAFFAQQLDYIFFFYGLAFIVLAIVCFSIGHERERRLPWPWLGAFGVIHGLNEWLDLAAFSLGDAPLFAQIRLAVLIASYLVLFEFARRSITVVTGKKLPVFLIVPFICAAACGVRYGMDGLNAASRYALGLTGGLGAAWAIYRVAQQDKRYKRPLVFFGISFACYAFFTGAIVPRVPFVPGSLLHYESFFSVIGAPVQFFRGLAALLSALAIWGYAEEIFRPDRAVTPTERRRAAAFHALAVSAFTLILVVGWFFTVALGSYAKRAIAYDARMDSNLLRVHIDSRLEKVDQIAAALKGSPWIAPALIDPSPENLAHAESVLKRYAGTMGASVCYLMDRHGVVVASSNQADPDSFVGHAYAFRPYFRESITAGASRYFAVGVTSGRRGYYGACAVADESGRPIGVAVVKQDMEHFEKFFNVSDYSFLIDPQGVIFLASQPVFTLKSLRPLTDSERARLGTSRQYGDRVIEPIFDAEPIAGTEITFRGQHFFVERQEIGYRDWAVVTLNDAAPIFEYRLFAIFIILIGMVMIVIFLAAYRQQQMLAESRLRLLALAEEERFIIEHTRDLAFRYDVNGVFTYVSPSVTTIVGYTQDEWLRHNTTYMTDNPVNKRAVELSKRALASGVDGPSFEVEIRHKDGYPVMLEINERPHVENGRVIGMIGTGRDITERKEAERLLAEVLDLNKKMVSAAPVGIIVYHVTGECISVNPAACQIVGASAEAIRAQNFRTIDSWKRSGLLGLADEALLAREGRSGDFHFITSYGKEVWLEVYVTPFASGEEDHLLLIINDVGARRKAENALRESEERFRRVFDSSGIGISINALDGRWIKANHAFCAIVGYAEEEILARTIFDLTPEADQEQDRRVRSRLLAGEIDSCQIEKRYIHKRGHYVWIQLNSALLRDQEGNPLYFITQIQDITNRRLAQAKLQEHAIFLQTLIDAIPSPVYFKDRQRRYLGCNRAYEEFMGITRGRVIGKTVEDIVAPQIAAFYHTKDDELFKTPGVQIYEAELEHADGSAHNVIFNKATFNDADGAVAGIVGVIIDITDRKKAEEMRLELQRKYEDLINSLNVGVYRTTPGEKGSFIEVNPALIKLIDADTREELLRHAASDFYVDPEERRAFSEKMMRQGYVQAEEVRFKTLKGRQFDAALTAVVRMTKGGQVYFDGIIEDITERKLAENKLREAIETKSKFTSMVSHELRTPLTAIKEGIGVVLDGTTGLVTDEQREFLDLAKRNVDRLARLINDVLDFQKLELGKMTFYFEEGDINEIASEVFSTMASIMDERKLKGVLQLDRALPQVRFDRDRMTQVMSNLVSNAIKFTAAGTVTLSTTGRTDGVLITVRDTGPGIRPEDRARLFGSFEQLGPLKDRKGGTGLGLAISKEIVEAHHGTIGVESVVGEGSVFTVFLPATGKVAA